MHALRTGYFTASYVSSIDDSEQPFALWVPRTYSARKKYPLVVALHGSDADHRMIPEKCYQITGHGFSEDVILLSPFGRGEVDFRWMGEADVWDTMNWVKNRYRIDARRQYLTGLSMGGFATWRLACAYPEQWAAIVPVCGGGEVSALMALKKVPVWCVHGARDDMVAVENSRRLVRELKRLKFAHRYDELRGWGHNAWEWLYDPQRKRDTLVGWLLQFRKSKTPPPIARPRREGVFHDLFSERLIISYPAQTAIPREVDALRGEAERLARFSFSDFAMRSGKLRVQTDAELSPADLRTANQLLIGRTDNHRWLKQIERKLLARHVRGQMCVRGETYLGKTLIAAVCQPNPWNKEKLLGVITYQQCQQLRGVTERLCGPPFELQAVNVYDALQRRFIRREAKTTV